MSQETCIESVLGTTMSGTARMMLVDSPAQSDTDTFQQIFQNSDLTPPCEGKECELPAVAAIKFVSHGNHLNRYFLSCRPHTDEAVDPGYECPVCDAKCKVEDIQWL